MKKHFWIDALIATFFVFLVMWGIFRFTQLNFFNAFDSIGKALSDVELTDLVFSRLRTPPEFDENITIVNIGNLSRREVAQQIKIINKYKPKVIGIDSFFDCQGFERDTINCPQLKDELGNLMLSDAIKEAGNVILVTRLEQTDSLKSRGDEFKYDSLEQSDSIFRDYALGEGFANLDTEAAFQDDVKTCRGFYPKMLVREKDELAFAVKVASVFDSIKTKRFLRRDNEREVINFRGNVFDLFNQNDEDYKNKFFLLDVNQVMNEEFVSEIITNRIVIMGFLGEELGDPSWSDKFYTPLNNKLAGKSNPDMFGVVIHANIVGMILAEDYVNEMPEWQEYLLAFILCYMNIVLFSLIYTKLPDWYDGITKLLQVMQLLVLSALMVFAFHWYSFKFDVTIALATTALVGDTFEVYQGVVKNMYRKITARKWFTKKRQQVLTPHKQEEVLAPENQDIS